MGKHMLSTLLAQRENMFGLKDKKISLPKDTVHPSSLNICGCVEVRKRGLMFPLTLSDYRTYKPALKSAHTHVWQPVMFFTYCMCPCAVSSLWSERMHLKIPRAREESTEDGKAFTK